MPKNSKSNDVRVVTTAIMIRVAIAVIVLKNNNHKSTSSYFESNNQGCGAFVEAGSMLGQRGCGAHML